MHPVDLKERSIFKPFNPYGLLFLSTHPLCCSNSAWLCNHFRSWFPCPLPFCLLLWARGSFWNTHQVTALLKTSHTFCHVHDEVRSIVWCTWPSGIWSMPPSPSFPFAHHPMLWVKLSPPKIYIEAPTPSTCEWDLIWKWDVWRGSQVKMRSSWMLVDPNPMTLEEEGNLDTDTQGECQVKTKVEVKLMCLQDKENKGLLTTTGN